MKKWGNVYNLYASFKEFKEKAEKKDFYFEEVVAKYDVIKYRKENLIVGDIFNKQFLIIHCPPFDIDREPVKRKEAVKQLEKIAKEFVIRF